MHEQLNSAVTRAILHALPTAVLALDSTDTILVANSAVARLLGTPREHLEGGSLSRFTNDVDITTTAKTITFTTSQGTLDLATVAKDVIVDDSVIKVVLLKSAAPKQDNALISLIENFSTTHENPYQYLCDALVTLRITQAACIRSVSLTTDVLATTADAELFEDSPTISRIISRDELTQIELVLVPDSSHGLTREHLAVVDMFSSLLHLRVNTLENATDASGSETALALALKAGDMGMCFFDPVRGDCYLSDHLTSWCGINPETFPGTVSAWLESFQPDDRARITTLFSQLNNHKKFKTVVNVHTLEEDMRLELFGRPLHDNASEWVVIAKPFRDEQEVEAAWHTRIAMEESARIEAEEQLDAFEHTLVETLLPTTSDVSIMHSRQDAGTWHIVRPLGIHSSMYVVGAVVSNSRNSAVVGATLCATMADVLAREIDDVDEYVALLRDHARARDIETSIAAVRVIDNMITTAHHGGASAYISGRELIDACDIKATTALSVSSHSEASPETIDVAANGRPWRILSTVIEVVSIIDVREVDHQDQDEPTMKPDGLEHLTGRRSNDPRNISPFRSGSISPT